MDIKPSLMAKKKGNNSPKLKFTCKVDPFWLAFTNKSVQVFLTSPKKQPKKEALLILSL